MVKIITVIVDELPEKGNNYTIYLKKTTSGTTVSYEQWVYDHGEWAQITIA